MLKRLFSLSIIACLAISLCISSSKVEASKYTSKNEQTVNSKSSTNKTEIKKNESAKEVSKKNEVKKNDTSKNETKKSETKKVETKKTETKPTIVADGKVTEEDFAVIVNDVEVKFGEDINEYLKKLGDPDDFSQARSCLHDGDDKIFVYGDVTLYTFPNGKKDILYIAEYTGETKTKSGINVGSTKDDVIKAYGKKYEEDPVFMVYSLDELSTISIQMENNKVVYVEIYKE